MSEVTKKDLEAAKRTTKVATSVFTRYWRSDNERGTARKGGICYADLYYRNKRIESFWTYHEASSHKPDLDWYDFNINHSPWAHCFLTKDPVECVTSGIWFDCDQPKNHVFLAATTIRTPRECGGVGQHYSAFRSLGMSQIESYLLAAAFCAGSFESVFDSFWDSGHTAMPRGVNIPVLLAGKLKAGTGSLRLYEGRVEVSSTIKTTLNRVDQFEKLLRSVRKTKWAQAAYDDVEKGYGKNRRVVKELNLGKINGRRFRRLVKNSGLFNTGDKNV